VKGKEKEKSVKMRSIPGRVASTWGRPSDPEVGELEEVIYCSEGSLRRVRRRLNLDGDGAVYVKIKSVDKATVKQEKAEDAAAEKEYEEDQGLEGWLTSWKQVPEGCCVIAVPAKEDWTEWASVRSAH